MNKAILNLDCVPYNINIEPKHGRATIEVGDSILAQLDNRTTTTNNPFSGGRNKGVVTGIDGAQQVLSFVFEEDDEALFLSISGFKGDANAIVDSLTTWIDENYDAIESVGWEVLRTQKEIEKYF